MRIAGLLLAAGAGRRFGGRKQLALIGDKPLVRCTLEALAAVLAEQPYIVLGAYRADIRPIVEDIAQVIDHSNWQKGLGSSIAYGVNTIEARQRYDGILISLADQFRLTSDDFNRLIERFDGDRIVAAHYAHSIGVPAIFPRLCSSNLNNSTLITVRKNCWWKCNRKLSRSSCRWPSWILMSLAILDPISQLD
jgi:molybdenum cofactor cytidylyltransferase